MKCIDCAYMQPGGRRDMSGYAPAPEQSFCVVEPRAQLRSKFSKSCSLFVAKEGQISVLIDGRSVVLVPSEASSE